MTVELEGLKMSVKVMNICVPIYLFWSSVFFFLINVFMEAVPLLMYCHLPLTYLTHFTKGFDLSKVLRYCGWRQQIFYEF